VASPAPDRSGFTLIEMLVALIISGIVVGTIFQLLVGQGRFVERQSAREEVQQNTRAALELISSELRTLPAGDGLILATSDSLTMRVVRIWGVVCAAGGGSSLDVVFPSIPGVSFAPNLGTGVVVRLGSEWSGSVRLTAAGNASASCNGEALGTGVERRTLSLSGTPQSSDGTLLPAVGDLVYIHDQVTYRSGTSAAVPGLWIQRRIGEGAGSSNQPFAGPILESGLRFEYFTAGSSVPLATPVSAAVRPDVARIAVVVESVSRNFQGEARESKSDTVVVALRNRM
jgi:prepilin-type N-terminal cleavage/methylation domain-containing protein